MALAPSAEVAAPRKPRIAPAPRWWETAFDGTWLRAYAHRNDEEALLHAPHVVRWLGVRAGARVLDVGCGAGRYARALAVRGLRVTGVDLSKVMLDEAEARSGNLPGAPTYIRTDARSLPFQEQFDGAISMFTSLGYFDDVEGDVQILRGVRRALVPGGRFLLDYLNGPHLRATFVETTDRVADGIRVREVREIDDAAPGGPVVLKRVTIRNPLTKKVEAAWSERVRIYGADEIDALLEKAGLRPVGHRMGDLDGTPHSWSSPRLVRLAERPRR